MSTTATPTYADLNRARRNDFVALLVPTAGVLFLLTAVLLSWTVPGVYDPTRVVDVGYVPSVFLSGFTGLAGSLLWLLWTIPSARSRTRDARRVLTVAIMLVFLVFAGLGFLANPLG